MPANWTKIFTLGSTGTGNEQLNGPAAIAVDRPYLYIADIQNTRILKWTLQGGEYVGSISGVRAWAMAVVGKYLYLMDTTNEMVHKYDKYTLGLVQSSSAFTNVGGMVYWRGFLWLADDTAKTVYKIDLNTLSVLNSLQLTGVTDAYEDIAACGDYLYLLTDVGNVYRITEKLKYDNRTVDLSAYLTDFYYIHCVGEYLFVSGATDSEFVVLDRSLQVIEDVVMDTTDWTNLYDAVEIAQHVFLVADYTGDQIVCMYGFDRNAGEASGDAITINGDSDQWTFGDDVIIGGTEANLTTKKFVRTHEAAPQSRNTWKRA